MYLDSDSEFHLNFKIVVSYVLLCHVEHFALILVRRFLAIFTLWVTIMFGFYFYALYFNVLLGETLFDIHMFMNSEIFSRIYTEGSSLEKTDGFYRFLGHWVFIPLTMTVALFVLLAPMACRKQSMSQTLLQKGDLRFFGDPFPEKLVPMQRLRKRPKPSKEPADEVLLFRNMLARIQNLGKPRFWGMWWRKFVWRGFHWFVPVRLPLAIVMLVLHAVPIFSVWANFLETMLHNIAHSCSRTQLSTTRWRGACRASLWVIALVAFLLGILLVFLTIWLYLYIYFQFIVFLFIDILRNASSTLPQCIVVLSIIGYIIMAFDHFEEDYRYLKGVVLDLCRQYSTETLEGVEEESEVVLLDPPYEPLYIKTAVS